MVTDGIFDGAEFVKDCVEYLVETEIIEFTDVYRNGYVELLTDVEGNDLMRIVVTLSDENGDYAKTDLDFKPFSTAKKAPFKVVHGKNDK